MKKIFTLVFILYSALAQSQSKNVLFIGNSYISRNNLPQLIGTVAASVGDNLNFVDASVANASLSEHSTNPNTLKDIRLGGWDYVVLQEYSTFPSNDITWVQDNVYPFATYLAEEIATYNPTGRTMFYMTWGRKDGDPDRCPFYPAVCTYEGMDDLTRARYIAMAADNNAVLSPVGAVWRYLRTNSPLIELYEADGANASAAGLYAAACTFYTAIFRKDPTTIPFNSTLLPADAATIRAAVKTIVFDNMATWHLQDTKAPSAPTGLTASAKTETGFTLTWAASSDDVGVTGYDVYQDAALIRTVTGTSADITGLTKATAYAMTVIAKDAAGNSSPLSAPLSVTTADFQGKIMLTVSLLTAENKAYDATTTATLNTSAATLNGIVSPDVVTLVSTGATGAFIDMNIGAGKKVFATGFTLGGADAAKYILIQPDVTANITVKPVTVTVTVGQSKVYGADDPVLTYSPSPALSGSDVFTGTLTRLLGEDVYNFYDITRGTLYAGTNYALTFVGGNFAITAKPITVTATPGQTKVYGAADPVFAYTPAPALIGTDVFTGLLSRAAGENAGDYAIAQGTLSAGTNYTLTFVPNNFTITAKSIIITATEGQTKVYGQVDPAFTYTFVPALESGDSFTGILGRTAGKDVGTYPFNLGTLSAGLNYSLFISSSPTFSITSQTLSITGISASDKIYNGNTTATLSGTGALTGIVSPDVVTLAGTPVATFASANVGTGLIVTVTGFTLAGADAGNYTVTQPAGLLADITTRELTITGLTANNKEFDGNTDATLTGTAALTGVVSPDVVILGGTPVATFASSAVADNIPVTVTGYTISGAGAGNYTLAQPAGLMANITIVSAIEDIYGKFECTVYPNPATDFVTLSIENYDIENLSYMLFNGRGNIVENQKITSNKTLIPMQGLVSGTYFIKIANTKSVIKTIKIIKH